LYGVVANRLLYPFSDDTWKDIYPIWGPDWRREATGNHRHLENDMWRGDILELEMGKHTKPVGY